MERQNKKETIAIDFDGVIHRYSRGWLDGTIYDEPVEGAKEALAKLTPHYKIVIFTTRLNPAISGNSELQEKYLIEWFDKYGFTKGIHFHDITGGKIPAMIYLDDRGMKFTDWKSALGDITERVIELGKPPKFS